MSRQVDVKSLVSHIIRGDGTDKCRICLGDTSEGQVYLGDTVMLDGNKPVTLAELLETITGIEMEIDISLPSQVCGACAHGAVTCAAYRDRCRDSQRKWSHIAERLSELSNRNKPTNTLFVIIKGDSVKTMHDNNKILRNTNHILKALKSRMNIVKHQRRRKNKLKLVKKNEIDSDVECPYCRMPCLSYYYLNLHLNYTDMRACHICSGVYKLRQLSDHIQSDHEIKAFPCDVCAEVFLDKSKLRKHAREAHRGSHLCIDCLHSFPSSSSHAGHVVTHAAQACPGCGVKFKNRKCFLYHKTICKKYYRPSLKYTCDHCSKSYDNKYSLRTHIRIQHLDEKLFQCHVCGKKLASESHLLEHINTHVKVLDRYVCEFCSKKYSTRRGYEKHLGIHFEHEKHLKEYVRLKKLKCSKLETET